MTTEQLKKLIREAIQEVLNESCAACAESTEPCEECNEDSPESEKDKSQDEPGRGWETDVGAKMDPRELDPNGPDYDPEEFREWLTEAKEDPAVKLVLKEYVNHKDKTKANTILFKLYAKRQR